MQCKKGASWNEDLGTGESYFFENWRSGNPFNKRYGRAERNVSVRKIRKPGKYTLSMSGTTFDIADTTFPLEKYPQLLTRGHDSQKHQNYLSALSCYAAEKLHTNSFWGAEEKEIHGVGIRGFYRRDEIHVMSNLKATEALSTYMHELGHNLMHHEQKEKTSAQREFEADVFCVLLATHLGIEVEKSRKSHLHACYKDLQAQEGISVAQVMEQVYQVYRSALKEIDFYLKQEKNLRVQKSSEKLMKL